MSKKMEHFSSLCLVFLYGLLSVLCLLLIVSAAGVYKSIEERSQKTNSTRTALEYVFNKLSSSQNNVRILNEQEILLEQARENKTYYTIIYERDGTLYEYTGIENSLKEGMGDKICETGDFSIQENPNGYVIKAGGQSLFLAKEYYP